MYFSEVNLVLSFLPLEFCIQKHRASQNNIFLEELKSGQPIKYQSLQLIHISYRDWSTAVDILKCSLLRADDLISRYSIWTAMISVSAEHQCQCKAKTPKKPHHPWPYNWLKNKVITFYTYLLRLGGKCRQL